ncbi:UNVERIFIED_CONTAM: hypothetical protein PYX00_004488 [Menopon gallinae]|uniref:Cleavage stimulation factor subunit 1 n=1 Tax=Menopon gallinae TaxID=328185 RepID=A0AAW2I4E7_9NEOP
MPDIENTSEINDENVIKRRELLYRLMISQLFYDGHQSIAVSLTSAIQPDPPCPPSDRLFNLVSEGLKYEKEMQPKKDSSNGLYLDTLLGPGLDLEFDTDIQTNAPEPASYVTAYVTSHKAPCRACAFSNDGQLIATGSADTSIKVLDVDRMVAKAYDERAPSVQQKENYETHPVIRTLYDHLDEVTCLEFHPKEAILVSGSRDNTVKLFDYSKSSVKKAYKVLQDAEQVKCMSLHPTGDYLVVGTNHFVIRVYDLTTAQCYVCNFPSHQHTKSITSVKYSKDGRHYVTSSRDGSIKVWDGVSNRCINTFQKAHDGSEVCSVEFSRNSKYILSSGKDSLVKLWELTTSRCLIAYTGAGTTGKQEHRAQAVFNHTEDYVMFPDEATTSLCAWNARNASRRQLLSLGHNGPVRMIMHSPTGPAFVSCSDDHRARFWQRRTK